MPCYCYRCTGCGAETTDYRAVAERNDGPECRCGRGMERSWESEGGRRPMMQEFHTPIEMFSIALSDRSEIREFQKRHPNTTISDRPSDPLFGVPIARTRQEKLAILKSEGFLEKS